MSVRVALRCCSGETDDKWQPATSKHGIHEASCQSAVAVRKGMERKQHVTCKGRQGSCQHVARWQPALAVAGSPLVTCPASLCNRSEVGPRLQASQRSDEFVEQALQLLWRRDETRAANAHGSGPEGAPS